MPDMSEASIYEALGVTPQSEGGKEQEIAEPAAAEPTTPTEEGGKEQEKAEHAPAARVPSRDNTPASVGETKDGNDPSSVTPQSGATPSPQGEGQNGDGLSDEQRRENAARRRREEQQQAVNEALAQERERTKGEWKAFFAKANLKNTLTGKPITSKEEFDEWHAAFEAAKLERDLKAGKLTPEGLEQAIRKVTQGPPSPGGQPRAAAPTEGGTGAEAQQSAQDMAATKARIDAEIQEIHKMDPTINTPADLLKMPNAKEFYEYVRRGNTFLDAYRLANREKLEAKIAEAAKQQTMNAARSKDHLNATGNARGGGASSVPAEEMELFHLMNPDASEAEIQAYYNKSRAKG